MIINASAHNIPLADKTVHAAITSPPYFGLRKYEGAQDVDWPAGVYAPMTGCPPCVEVPAIRCPLGNEPTIEAFIWHLLLVMRELRRVLRDDGTCWINLGDSFSGNTRGTGGDGSKSGLNCKRKDDGTYSEDGFAGNKKFEPFKMDLDLSGGNLLAIPHRFALAVQADNWTLRNDCVWHKKSCMPESVSGWKFQDDQLRRGSWRHTRAHEYVFQFVKGMGYWSDSEIVKEAAIHAGDDRKARAQNAHKTMPNELQNGIRPGESNYDLSGRNPRSVFSPAPSPYSGAHFATWPKELVRPLILSSVPRRCCPECGQGWAAVVEKGREIQQHWAPKTQEKAFVAKGKHGASSVLHTGVVKESLTTGYRPTCDCGREDYTQGICLDPFVGSGTTLEVARECGVKAVGLDISREYLENQASWRGLRVAKPDFSQWPLFAEQYAALTG